MAKIKVYSKLPSAVQFRNPKTQQLIKILGMNSHKIMHSGEIPYPNDIDASDWEYIKLAYKDYPAYFNKLDGDSLFVAETEIEAKTKLKDGKQTIDDKNVLTKTPKVTKSTDKDGE